MAWSKRGIAAPAELLWWIPWIILTSFGSTPNI